MLNNLAKLVINNGGSITPLILSEEQGRGMGLCNVSILLDDNGELLANIRNVHYILYHDEFGQNFHCRWGVLSYLNPEDDIKLRTFNYFCKLDPDTLEILSSNEVDTSLNDIEPVWEFIGLEDVRLFRWEGQLYYCGVRRDVKNTGEGRMELCKLDVKDNNVIEATRERIEVDPHTHLEKNWMPILDMPYHFVRWCDPLEIIKVNPNDKSKQRVEKGVLDIVSSKVVIKKDQNLNLPLGLRGSSQVIPFGNEGDRICITHETDFYYHQNKKKDAQYYHRFVIWDKDWNVKKISKQFKFMGAMIEFCCGMAIKDNNFIITYGYQDNAAYALKMPINLLDKIEWTV